MRWAALLVLLVACGGGRASAPEADALGDTALAVVTPPDTTLPASRRGSLIARSALPGPFSGAWQPAAGVCGSPPSLQLLASGDSVDVLILLRLAAEGPATGTYTVASAEDTSTAPRTARVGLQLVSYADRALRSERGSVELSRLDRLVSGRFDVVLREFTSPDTVRYLGVFERIRVDSLPEPACRATTPDVPPRVY